MAKVLGPNYKVFIELDLDRLKDARSRARMVFFFGAFMLLFLSGTLITHWILNSNVWQLFSGPFFGALAMIMPLRVAYMIYFGKTYPQFNYWRKSWVFKKPTTIAVELENLDELKAIQEWLAENIASDNLYEARSVATNVLVRVFLFKDPKDAMLFKLFV